MCGLSWNLGASTSWNTQGLSRPVMGLVLPLPTRVWRCERPAIFHLREFLKPSQLITSFFFSSVISNQSTWVLYELMCWLSLVVRSLPARRSLSWIQSTVDWVMAPRNWRFNLKSNSTNYPDHDHHGDPPPIRKNSDGRAGTSCLVVRSSDHQTTRLVMF